MGVEGVESSPRIGTERYKNLTENEDKNNMKGHKL
jgi:hypothetical protein